MNSVGVSALVSEVQRDLQLAGQVFSFAEISGAVQLVNATAVEATKPGGHRLALGTWVLPDVQMDEQHGGDTRVAVRFNDFPKMARRLGTAPGEPLA